MSKTLSLFDQDIHTIDFTLIEDPSQLPDMFKVFKFDPILGYDLEFGNLNSWTVNNQLLWQLSNGEQTFVGKTHLVPLHLLSPLLSNKPVIAHNGITEFKQSYVNGLVLKHIIDPMLAYQVAKAGLLEGSAKRSASLASLMKQYMHKEMKKEVRSEFINYTGTYFTREQLEYSAMDVIDLIPLWNAVREELLDKKLYDVAMFECSLIPTFGCAELTGMTVDKDKWKEYIGVSDENGMYPEGSAEFERNLLIEKCTPILLEGINRLQDNPTRVVLTKHVKNKSQTKKLRKHTAKEDPLQQRLLSVPVTNIKITSHDQVIEAFLGFGIDLNTTDKGALKDVIFELGDKVPQGMQDLLESLIDLSSYQKLVSTYGMSMLAKVQEDGTLWADLKQLGASATGRCSSPVFMNLPARGEIGSAIRGFFVAPPKSKLIIADYSQLEQRIAAHCSQDPVMLKIFLEGLDMHGVTAAGIFGVPYEEFVEKGEYDATTGEYGNKNVTLSNGLTIKYMRDVVAKTCAFASNYGGNAKTLRKSLRDKTDKELETIYGNYASTYRVLFEHMVGYGHDALTKGYTENLVGRKRFYWPTKWEDPRIFKSRERKDVERRKQIGTDVDGKLYTMKDYEWDRDAERDSIRRAGLNATTQSLAADIMKRAMLYIYIELEDKNLLKVWGPGRILGNHNPGACIVNTVHDEIITRVDEEVAEEVAEIVQRCMLRAESEILTTVPAGCVVHICANWSEK